MSAHIVSVQPGAAIRAVVVSCSCGNYKGPEWGDRETRAVTLERLNEIARTHIETEESS